MMCKQLECGRCLQATGGLVQRPGTQVYSHLDEFQQHHQQLGLTASQDMLHTSPEARRQMSTLTGRTWRASKHT